MAVNNTGRLADRYSLAHYPPLEANIRFKRLSDRRLLDALLLVDDNIASMVYIKDHMINREVPYLDHLETSEKILHIFALDLPWRDKKDRKLEAAYELQKQWRLLAKETVTVQRVTRPAPPRERGGGRTRAG